MGQPCFSTSSTAPYSQCCSCLCTCMVSQLFWWCVQIPAEVQSAAAARPPDQRLPPADHTMAQLQCPRCHAPGYTDVQHWSSPLLLLLLHVCRPWQVRALLTLQVIMWLVRSKQHGQQSRSNNRVMATGCLLTGSRTLNQVDALCRRSNARWGADKPPSSMHHIHSCVCGSAWRLSSSCCL